MSIAQRDSSNSYISGVQVVNFPIPPIVDDVREFIISAWTAGQPYLYDFVSVTLPFVDYKTAYQPFVITAHPDGSYTAKFRFRSYQLSDQAYPIYVMTDFGNNDPKGSPPRLLKPNIGATSIGSGNFALVITDYSSDNPQFLIPAYYDYGGDSYTPQRTLYYTLNGSTPSTTSAVYSENNPPQLTAGQTYTVKVISVADGWVTSDVQTATIVVNELSGNISQESPEFSPNFDVPATVNFNADSLFTGYDALQWTLSSSTDPIFADTNSTFFISYDGGLTWLTYTGAFGFPDGWKTPTGGAGFPTLLYYQKDDAGNQTIIQTQAFSFSYPNHNLVFEPKPNQTVNGNAVTLTNDATTDLITLFNLQTNITAIDDFRYFEFKAPTLIDPGQNIILTVNAIELNQAGDVLNESVGSSVNVPSLAWGQGDTVRVQFNYKDSSVRFAVNTGAWSDYFVFPDLGVVQIYASYGVNEQTLVTGTILQFNTKASQFAFALPDENTLALDTST